MASRDSIKVVCRIRPENALEMGGNYKRCVEHTKTDVSVSVSNSRVSLARLIRTNQLQNFVFHDFR